MINLEEKTLNELKELAKENNIKNISNINSNKNTILFTPNESCSIGAKYKNEIMEVFKNENFTNNLERINYGEWDVNTNYMFSSNNNRNINIYSNIYKNTKN